MANEHQTFTGDSSQLQKEYDKLAARAVKLEEQMNKQQKATSNANKEALKELRELNKQAEQTTRSVITPLEKYQEELAKLDKLLAKGAITQETYNRAVAKAGEELDAAGGKQEKLAKNSLKDIAGMATGWISVGAAIGVATRALEEQARVEAAIRGTQIDLAASQQELVLNLSGDSSLTSADKRKFLSEIEDVQKRTGFKDLGAMNMAAAGGIGAGGSREEVLDALEAAAKITRNTPDSLETFTSGAFDVSNASGVRDARSNLAFLLSAGGRARIVDPRLQAQNIAPAVASIVGTTNDKDRVRATTEAGALFSALANAAVDTTGESTRTASTAFSVQLRDFFEKGITEGSGKKKKLIKPGTDPGTLAGRIEALQSNAELREKFLGDATFEQRFKVPIEQLLRGGAPAGDFEDARRAISFDPKLFDRTAEDVATLTNPLRVAAAAGEGEGNITRFRANQDLAARFGNARQRVIDVAQEAFPGGFRGLIERNMAGSNFDVDRARMASAAPEEVAIRRFEQMRKNWALTEAKRPLTAEESKIIKLLEESIALEKQTLEVQRQAAGQGNRPAALAERRNHTEK